MKIAIISPYATVVPHFETELELAQQHLDAGDQVNFINCLGELANCDFNPNRDLERCRQCVGRREMGLEALSSVTISRSFKPCSGQSIGFPLKTDFDSIDEIKEYKIHNFDIGYAVLSSLVSYCRDPQPNLTEHRGLLSQFMQSAYQTYEATVAYLRANRPDRCYVFNGRFAAMRAVFRAAEAVGVDCYLHERGCDQQHFSLRKNHLPHDIVHTDRAIRQAWQQAGNSSDRERLADAWYHGRVAGVERNWHSFTKGQQPGCLPRDWDSTKNNVVIFNSSDDEFVAIGDCWKNDLYPDQVDAVTQLAASLASFPDVHLTLRMHPNLQGLENVRTRAWRELDYPNLRLITPDSKIDSYALMKASDCVVSFGSTAGIEAVFWQRPSVLLGPCFYQNLEGLYRPQSHSETIELVTSKLTPLHRNGALMYGYWQQTHGIPYQYFKASGLFEGQFKGTTLYARPPKKTLATRLKSELGKFKQKVVRPFS